MKIEIPSKTEIRNLIINELIKRDKLISKIQIKEIIMQEVTSSLKIIYKELDKLRRRLNILENE